MSKLSKKRTIDGEAITITKMIRSSPLKLSLVVDRIRGKPVSTALSELYFSRRAISRVVIKSLRAVISNAENTHNMNIDDLYVSEVWVGKDMTLHRGNPRARGRYDRIQRVFSQMTIKVREQGGS